MLWAVNNAQDLKSNDFEHWQKEEKQNETEKKNIYDFKSGRKTNFTLNEHFLLLVFIIVVVFMCWCFFNRSVCILRGEQLNDLVLFYDLHCITIIRKKM